MSKEQKKILVIDDDLIIIRLLEKILSGDGYVVHSASKSMLGLEKAKDLNPHLILLDVVIPDKNGLDLAREFLADEELKEIPIIFMTVKFDVKDDKGSLYIDIDGHRYQAFAKPLHNRKLLSTVRKTINRSLYNKPKSEESEGDG